MKFYPVLHYPRLKPLDLLLRLIHDIRPSPEERILRIARKNADIQVHWSVRRQEPVQAIPPHTDSARPSSLWEAGLAGIGVCKGETAGNFSREKEKRYERTEQHPF